MVTDTALFRYAPYHTPADTLEKLDLGRMARVVEGLGAVTAFLGRARSTDARTIDVEE